MAIISVRLKRNLVRVKRTVRVKRISVISEVHGFVRRFMLLEVATSRSHVRDLRKREKNT
mgnify:CR=1 FL=1